MSIITIISSAELYLPSFYRNMHMLLLLAPNCQGFDMAPSICMHACELR
jgi:hypothetical protein